MFIWESPSSPRCSHLNQSTACTDLLVVHSGSWSLPDIWSQLSVFRAVTSSSSSTQLVLRCLFLTSRICRFSWFLPAWFLCNKTHLCTRIIKPHLWLLLCWLNVDRQHLTDKLTTASLSCAFPLSPSVVPRCAAFTLKRSALFNLACRGLYPPEELPMIIVIYSAGR